MVHDCVVWGSVILLPDKEGECGGVEERRKWQDKVVKALQTANKIKKRGSDQKKKNKNKINLLYNEARSSHVKDLFSVFFASFQLQPPFFFRSLFWIFSSMSAGLLVEFSRAKKRKSEECNIIICCRDLLLRLLLFPLRFGLLFCQ